MHNTFGCALVTRHNIGIRGIVDSFGNIRLHGTFTNSKIDDGDIHHLLVPPGEWKAFVRNNKWLKNGDVGKHGAVTVLKCETLQKELLQKLFLLKTQYALPEHFNDNLKT